MKKRTKPKKEKPEKKRRGAFAVTKYALWYAAFFIVAVIFTQALRNPISGVFFILAASLPFIEVVYVLIAYGAVKSSLTCSHTEAEKKQPVEYGIIIENSVIFPYPFVEAEFILPEELNMRCGSYLVRLSLTPRGSYNLRKTVAFPYRGSYTFGIGSIYVYDLLRLFRIRVKIDSFKNVFVTPRRLNIGSGRSASTSDSYSAVSKLYAGYDRAELTDIKEYRRGDHMKNIHWKLSSKKQELMVKHYGSNDGVISYVFPNFGSQYNAPEYDADINEYCADAATEITCAAVDKLLDSQNTVELIFDDSRQSDGVCRQRIENNMQFEQFFRYFSSSPVVGEDCDFAALANIAQFSEGTCCVFVTSFLSDKTVKEICDIYAAGAVGDVMLYLYIPYLKTKNPAAMHDEYDKYITSLTESGVQVRLISEKELA